MSYAVTFTVPGPPVAKGRARAGTGHHYTPAKTRNAEAVVAAMAREAMAGGEGLTGPLRLELYAMMPVPSSWSGVKRIAAMAGTIRPVGKPDLDNIVKLAKDGMNKIVYGDDAQITEVRARKEYGANPRTVITVSTI